MTSSASSPALRPRPSTWNTFLWTFAYPMAALVLISNWGAIEHNFVPGAAHQSSEPASSSAGSPLHATGTAARVSPEPTVRPTSASSSVKESHAKTPERSERPTAPQTSPEYIAMEKNIKRLRFKYEKSAGTEDEILAGMRFADYLKYRDSKIFDGGTYQMEAISVYRSVVTLLEDQWRAKMSLGDDSREIQSREEKDLSGYSGLNRELFLNYESKSVEGLLCSSLVSLGKVQFMSNMFERAVQSYEECLSFDGNYLDALTYRAQAFLILGKFDEAGRDYTRVLELDTDRVFREPISGLAKVLTAKEDAVPGGWTYLVETIEAELDQQTRAYEKVKAVSADNSDGIKHLADGLKRMHLTLFQYHDVKTKNAAAAWKHLKRGNDYKLAYVAPFNEELEKKRALNVQQVFTPGFFPQGIGSDARTPIFIIGFVRSGSTLLERILDSHPSVVGYGENSIFNGRLDMIRNEIVRASMGGDPKALRATVQALADGVVSEMRDRWETIEANKSELRDDERRSPVRFVDKMLTNYMNVGFIHILFPNALILHVAREPMDTIFSAFKHDFTPGGLDYMSEFNGVARLYHSYRDVMEHWDRVLPGRVTHIRYEDLVTDLPRMAPKIIEAASVDWDPTVLDFHKKKHAVNTMSTAQVRQGVYSHHIKGWKRYEQYLGPLLDLVGDRVNYDLRTTLKGYTPLQKEEL
ncbi:hypothetical protein THAOC_34727 [Thalassiosira oceanica]|uniref:protein-tyrosine sulfotransferase n=1 Tax=Thalassiosira oceanica TaxID=159749 RepID=K0R4J2_THAOC|nr:hypothetical protein THAOC_34727 [Thalassiosira oceanica]|eukprot:EJK46594.1 hypothetical protein THAOC_34727 [Thalassiosira oceanica]